MFSIHVSSHLPDQCFCFPAAFIISGRILWTSGALFSEPQGFGIHQIVSILQRFPFSMALIVFFVIVATVPLSHWWIHLTSIIVTIAPKLFLPAEALIHRVTGQQYGRMLLAVITLCNYSLRGLVFNIRSGAVMLTIILCWCIVKGGQNILARNKKHV